MDRPDSPSDSLPETAEIGGEGGSFGDAASRQSRERPADGPDRVKNETVTDILGNVTRAADVTDRTDRTEHGPRANPRG